MVVTFGTRSTYSKSPKFQPQYQSQVHPQPPNMFISPDSPATPPYKIAAIVLHVTESISKVFQTNDIDSCIRTRAPARSLRPKFSVKLCTNSQDEGGYESFD